MITYQDKEIKVQSKAFDKVLGVFKIGSVVERDKSYRVAVEPIFKFHYKGIDSQLGLREIESIETIAYVALVIFDGIFIDYLIEPTKKEAEINGNKWLMKYFDVKSLAEDKLIEIVHKKDEEINSLKQKIHNVCFGITPFISFADGKLDTKEFFYPPKRKFNFHTIGWEDVPRVLAKSNQCNYFIQKIAQRIKENFLSDEENQMFEDF